MSNSKDKYVRKGRAEPRRGRYSFVSDSYTKAEIEALRSGGPMTVPGGWAAALGRRFELAVHRLGKDKSVHLLELSWKQLQRYFAGDSTVGASTLWTLATA